MTRTRIILLACLALSALAAAALVFGGRDGRRGPRAAFRGHVITPAEAIRHGGAAWLAFHKGGGNLDFARRAMKGCAPGDGECRLLRAQFSSSGADELLLADWTIAEAARQGLSATPQEIKAVGLPAFEGLSFEEMNRVRRVEVLNRKVQGSWHSDARPSEAQLRRAYRELRGRYHSPEAVYVQAAVTRSARRAFQAARLAAAGRDFGAVAASHTDNPKLAAGKGYLPAVTASSKGWPPGLAARFLAAPRGARDPAARSDLPGGGWKPGPVQGPVKAGGVWWVYRIAGYEPAVNVSFAQARPGLYRQAKAALDAQVGSARYAAYWARWAKLTSCSGYWARLPSHCGARPPGELGKLASLSERR